MPPLRLHACVKGAAALRKKKKTVMTLKAIQEDQAGRGDPAATKGRMGTAA